MHYPDIDPVLLSLGPVQVRWYGVMYVLGFCASYYLVRKQIERHNDTRLAAQFENLNFLLILSVVLGGRLGYVLFYNLPYYLDHPTEIIATWNGGMSFHGACLTLTIAGAIFCRLRKLPFLKTADFYIVTVPVGLFLGRLGNFINGELFGRVTELPWGMIFPAGGPLPRHPSQLYEAGLEGIVLFLILWFLRNKPYRNERPWPHGSLLALFFIFYGIFRILVEFVREPDAQLGFLFSTVTMGQLLSFAMILIGITIFCISSLLQKRAESPSSRE